MENVCLLVAFLFATCTMAIVVSAVEFDQRQPSLYGDDYYYYYGGHTAAAAASENDEESQRTHHGKHKFKKLKKRLLLQCLLGHSRRRRDTSAASGRFLLPIVLQSTNVNVGPAGQQQQQHQQSHHGSECMRMFGDDSHGPLQGSLPSLGSLGSPLGSLGSAIGSLGSFGPSVTENPEEDESGNRNGLSSYSANWNRYARQFRRNFVRPLYRLF